MRSISIPIWAIEKEGEDAAETDQTECLFAGVPLRRAGRGLEIRSRSHNDQLHRAVPVRFETAGSAGGVVVRVGSRGALRSLLQLGANRAAALLAATPAA